MHRDGRVDPGACSARFAKGLRDTAHPKMALNWWSMWSGAEAWSQLPNDQLKDGKLCFCKSEIS